MVKEEDKEMESILKDILGEIRCMREDIKELKEGQKILQEKITNLEIRMDRIEIRMDKFEMRMDKIEIRQENLEKTVENGFKQSHEYFEHFTQVTDSIQRVVIEQHQNHEQRICKLERIVGFN